MRARLSRPTPLRVLMTADAVGGIWQYALDLAAGLSHHGVAVTLALLGPAPNPEQRVTAQAIPGLTLLETGLALDWLAEDADAIRSAGEQVGMLAQAVGADLVHLNSIALAAEAKFPAPVLGMHHSCVATWWAAVHPGEMMPVEFTWRTDLVAAGLRQVDRALAPTRAFADAVQATYGLPEAPTVVHNGRNLPATAPAASMTPVAFTAGRLWDDGKNLAALDRAAALCRCPVHAAGPMDGPNGTRVAFRHIRALGALEESALRGCLARRPIYVSTALYEPFGLAVLEAAQAGCALVLSDIPGFRELWGEAAVFVPPHDEHAIATAINALLARPELRTELGRTARARACRYSVPTMVRGTREVYRDLRRRRTRSHSVGAAA